MQHYIILLLFLIMAACAGVRINEQSDQTKVKSFRITYLTDDEFNPTGHQYSLEEKTYFGWSVLSYSDSESESIDQMKEYVTRSRSFYVTKFRKHKSVYYDENGVRSN